MKKWVDIVPIIAENLSIKEEEVIKELKEYSKVLHKEIQKGEYYSYDLFFIGKLQIQKTPLDKFRGLIKKGHFSKKIEFLDNLLESYKINYIRNKNKWNKNSK